MEKVSLTYFLSGMHHTEKADGLLSINISYGNIKKARLLIVLYKAAVTNIQ